MIVKKFNDNYDAEFVNLMLDVQSMIENFCKSDKLKINSWAKILCVPTINIEFKKNRNLYAIKLLDNVLNGKLEDPFNKFARDKELKMLDPILVKTQLTSKFLNEIKKYEYNDYEYYLTNPNPAFNDLNQYDRDENFGKFGKKAKNVIKRQKSQNNFYKNNSKNKNLNLNKKVYVDYDNQFLLLPANHKRSKSSYKIPKINPNFIPNYNNYYLNSGGNDYDLNRRELTPSDILLIKNFGNLPYKNNSNLMELRNHGYNRYEKFKLKNIADALNEQRLENIGIILNQKKEIDELKKRISLMQLKIKKIYNSQK